jgi:hypothetical protein
MKKYIVTSVTALAFGLLAGCGGGSTSATSVTPASISGTVADGYLAGANVFLDKNGNYQLDPGEPFTTTNANGAFTMNIDPADMGKYPVMAMAIAGQTIDKDTNATVPNSYMLSMPAAAMSGSTNSNFISPLSTMIQAKMEANPGMSLTNAMAQLRNQLNMPAGVNMMGDYLAGSASGPYQTQYQTMHQVAQQMASLMASQANLVMNGTTGVYMGRYQSMMGLINQNLPQISTNVGQGMAVNSTFMNSMTGQMQTTLARMPIATGTMNSTTMFNNMTSHQYFWNYTGSHMLPKGGMM